jgi:hypothetical protein
MRILARLFPVALAFLPAACFLSRRTVNEPIREEKLAALVPGKTTAAEVVTRLGAPSEVVQLGRRSAYRYEATTTKDTGLWLLVVGLYNSDAHADRVWVFFDENNVLAHVGATLAAEEAEHALPWSEIHGR